MFDAHEVACRIVKWRVNRLQLIAMRYLFARIAFVQGFGPDESRWMTRPPLNRTPAGPNTFDRNVLFHWNIDNVINVSSVQPDNVNLFGKRTGC